MMIPISLRREEAHEGTEESEYLQEEGEVQKEEPREADHGRYGGARGCQVSHGQ